MHPQLTLLRPVFVISASLLATAAALDPAAHGPLSAAATDAAVTMLTTKILESSQFAHQQLNAKLAGKFLDRYLDALDAAHMLFVPGDIEGFTRQLPALADATRAHGDSSLAHVVFQRFLERLDQRVAFITGLLDDGSFDFSADETFHFDRKEAARPADLVAAQALWRLQLRYDYLQEKLAGKQAPTIVKTLRHRAVRSAETMHRMDDKAVLEIYLEALAQVYDPHSDYMGPKQLKSFETAMKLSLIGIGASLRSLDGYCKIMELIPGGPAARSGQLKIGDRIVGVAQKEGDEFTDLVDLPLAQAVELIRGPKDTPVFLNLIPANASDDSLRKTLSLVREEIKLEDQQAKAQIIDLPAAANTTQRIGVIDLPSFYSGEATATAPATSCSADVASLLTKLKEQDVTGIILDLRRNGGGSLREAIDLTGLFIPSGPVVQTRNLEGHVELGSDSDDKVAYDGPLLVLTSRLSASASEIVAGALQDYGRALIVGDAATFGKGTVQTIVPLARVMQQEGLAPDSDPGALKVTISKFYRPSGKSTQLEGVKADIVIPSLTDVPEIGESDLLNPLPWDTLPAAPFTPSDRVQSSLASLRSHSAQRLATDADFADLNADIERFRQLQSDKSVSLNEDRRQREKAELKARQATAKKARLARAGTPPPAYQVTLKGMAHPGPGEPVKPKPALIEPDADADAGPAGPPAEDIILREAQAILLDYAGLLHDAPAVSQR
ncbi:MAG: tail-specific protease [Verrucomicrobia bacterium]|nr:MAG: tail-specific protease [Verrucomicrobiota bacterium]